jgi:phosphatidate cytidylyltransferase
MLRDRLLAAIFGLPMLLLMLWLNWALRSNGFPASWHLQNSDNLPLLLIVLIIAVTSGYEISGIVRHRYPGTAQWNGVYAAVILPFLVHGIRLLAPTSSLGLLIDSLGATIAVMLLFLAVWSDAEQRGKTGLLENLIVVGGGIYVGTALSAVLLIGSSSYREIAVLLAFLGVFALDTFAYFGGKRLGGPPLAAHVSPKKTWAGAACGLVAAVIMALLFKVASHSFPHPDAAWRLLSDQLTWGQMAIIGIGIGVAGQIGDLLESAFKRWGGVKDSGNLLPGHGGFLDRFDSLFLAAPVSYLLLASFLLLPK